MKHISHKEAKSKKLKKFFTGKKCIYGHISERYTANYKCIECTHIPDELNKFKAKTKKCTSCYKNLEKNDKNFRFKNKSKNILTFRQPCRACEQIDRKKWGESYKGKEAKKKYDENYRLSGKKKNSDKKYYQKNKEEINKKNIAHRKIKRKTDPDRWLHDSVSARLRLALASKNITKKNRTTEYIGCSIKDLKKHLEQYFIYDKNEKRKYSWDNRGKGGWDVDHIIPINYFKENYIFTDLKIQKVVWHYSNLQPLWGKLNRNIKRDRMNKIFAEKKIKLIKKYIKEKTSVDEYWNSLS